MNKAQLVEYIQKSGQCGETKTAAERALAARKRECLGFLRELKREVIRNRAEWFPESAAR